MVVNKNYKSFTGLTEFYYGELNPEETGITGTAPELIDFLQSINVGTPAEISRAHGSNKVAELAIANGPMTLETGFHKVPIEDKARLIGLKKVGTGYARTPNMTPPYVACVFARTAEDGGTEWLGFAKGIFMMASTAGTTKSTGAVEFGSDAVTAEFMSRDVVGIEDEDEGTMFIFHDAKGSTASRDFLFNLVFGVPHPDAPVEPAGV